MKYYFDVTETYTQTIAIEADNQEQARKRIENAYYKKEFIINHEYFTAVKFEDVQEDVEKSIKDKFIA